MAWDVRCEVQVCAVNYEVLCCVVGCRWLLEVVVSVWGCVGELGGREAVGRAAGGVLVWCEWGVG